MTPAILSDGNVNPPTFTVTVASTGLPGDSVVGTPRIDDGTVQRSEVRSLTVTFASSITANQLSTVLANLSLTRISDGLVVGLTGTLDATGKVLTLKFSGSSIIGGSLADGRYTLTYGGTTLLDGSQLWRLYGTGKVDSSDQTAFNKAYGTRKGVTLTNGKAYNQYFDYTQNGFITIDSQTAFNQRLGKMLDANGHLVPIS